VVVQFSGLISLINIGNSLLIIYMPEIPDLSKKKKDMPSQTGQKVTIHDTKKKNQI
jgi:hypothetical protein